MDNKLLFIISGPSAVGKRCILDAISLYCKLDIIKSDFNKIVLYNSRDARNNEIDGIDYHFISQNIVEEDDHILRVKKICINKISKLANYDSENVIQIESNLFKKLNFKSDFQVLDLSQITNSVNFLEIKDTFLDALHMNANFEQHLFRNKIKLLKIFIAPFTKNEMIRRSIFEAISIQEIIKNEMAHRIRNRRKIGYSTETNDEIEKRSGSAVKEVLRAFDLNSQYDVIFVNPYSESDIPWGTKNTFPSRDGRDILNAISSYINNEILKL